MPVLSAEDLEFFDQNGYVVVPDAVPPENLEATINAIWDFLEMNPDDPNDWYRPPHLPSGTVEMFQHPALWNNRQYPRVHEAFAQLLGTEKLWVSEDRASMKPPSHPDHPKYDNKGFTHWDLDTSKPLSPKLRLQGVLVLADTSEEMGGFQCVPGFHKDLDKWIAQQPADRNPNSPDLNTLPPGMKVTPIPSKAGDLIIWNNLLAHGNGHNVGKRPRLAQYITMFPAPDPASEQYETWRQKRIERWQNRRAPDGRWVTGDPRHKEELQQQTAELTPLGRKLLGLDAWE
jgi:ectoine hydroxylase-related dioxygenase (phytanoyl-CoA dioxygenase family)